MTPFELLVEKFNFRKQKGICMANDCSAKSSKEILFREFQLKEHNVKDLAKIQVCEKHSDVNDLLKQLNKLTGEFKLVRAETKDL